MQTPKKTYKSKNERYKLLFIFDFDDTLIKSSAQVRVLDASGNELCDRAMMSSEYAASSPKHITAKERKLGYTEDFREFDAYPPGARLISSTFKDFKKGLKNKSNCDVVILTAREIRKPVAEYLKDQGIDDRLIIITTGGKCPSLKSAWVTNRLKRRNYTHVHVWEDSLKNISAIKKAVSKFPEIKFSYTHVEK